jgi:hypothetical protein
VEYLTIAIPVALWHVIDGCVDNSMALDVVEGDVQTLTAGSRVRDAGWRASAAYDGPRGDYGWPPADHLLPITLRYDDWRWAQGELDRWAPYSQQPGLLSTVRALVERSLTSTR